MSDNKYLNSSGVQTLTQQLKSVLATQEEVNHIDNETKVYLTEIDYSTLAFDTNEIVKEEAAA